MINYLIANSIRLVRLMTVILVLNWCANGAAADLFSSNGVEKPKPEFTRTGDSISAKFIPRAKSTSVTLEFQVAAGGRLEAVKGVDFAAVDRPEVDIKNFKSAAFEIDIRQVAVPAPIPGLIVEIKVSTGDMVQAGQSVAVMEAMKMENNLMAHISGIVREMLVQKGSVVATGDVILRIE